MIHRDLKPSNILVDENCDLKICNFGVACTYRPEMTGYITTRYYRAPETMLFWRRYDYEVDIWSAGCIMGEMLLGKPLFPGVNHVDQFHVIIDTLGTPPDELLQRVTSKNVSVPAILLFGSPRSWLTARLNNSSYPFQNVNDGTFPASFLLLAPMVSADHK